METQEIKRIVDKQIEVGLELVTDGEFRRTWWHSTLELKKIRLLLVDPIRYCVCYAVPSLVSEPSHF